jgi:DNA-binding NtrC family response regulator
LFENMQYRIIGNTIGMLRILEVVEAVKDSDSNVLISGESGTGKELIARTIANSTKNRGPFIVFNCTAIPKELVEAELFGWEQRDFSDHYSERMGKLEEASRGTLFLNEIGQLELSMQAKLMRVFQEKYIQRLGSSRRIKTNFRLISSTKYDLRNEIQNGNLREDLFHRISQVEIKVPPLRERKEDIPLLVATFLNEFCARDNKLLSVPDKSMKIFKDYDWPGNVRQLRNIVERAVMLASGDKITHKELPEEVFVQKKLTTNGNLLKTLRELEREALKDALEACKGNKSKASRMLGISRKSMYKRLREIRI